MDVTSGWLATEDEIFAARCKFDSGNAAFSFPGYIVVGEISPVISHFMSLTDEARRAYGQGYRASGKSLFGQQAHIYVFEDYAEIDAFEKFVRKWRRAFSTELVGSRIVIASSWRSEDIQTAIKIVREYRAEASECS